MSPQDPARAPVLGPLAAQIAPAAAALRPSLIREMSSRSGPDTLNLGLGQPALPPPAGPLLGAVQDMQTEGHGYTPNAGLPALRAAIASALDLPGKRTPDSVVVTVGSEQAVYLALSTLLRPGQRVLIPEPCYPAYPGIIRMLGGEPVGVQVDLASGLRLDPQRVQDAFQSSGAVGLILNSPSNPFGQVESQDNLQAIADIAGREGRWLLSDEIYRDLSYDGPVPSVCELLPERSLCVSGLSKSCAFTGLRLGYLLGPPDFVARATLVQQLMVSCAPRQAQHAALRVFEQPDLLTAHLPYYRQARAALREAAVDLPSQVSLHLGSGGFYAILDISALGEDALELALELLAAEDVAVVPGTAFGPSGGWFWRLSYAGGAELIREGVARIARFLSARG